MLLRLIYLLERQNEERQGLLVCWFSPECRQQLGLGQAEARKPGLHPCLPLRWQGPGCLGWHLHPRSFAGSWLVLVIPGVNVAGREGLSACATVPTPTFTFSWKAMGYSCTTYTTLRFCYRQIVSQTWLALRASKGQELILLTFHYLILVLWLTLELHTPS